VAKPTTANREVTTMAKKKGIRLIVTVECTEAKGEGGTPSRYCTQKVRGRGGEGRSGRCCLRRKTCTQVGWEAVTGDVSNAACQCSV